MNMHVYYNIILTRHLHHPNPIIISTDRPHMVYEYKQTSNITLDVPVGFRPIGLCNIPKLKCRSVWSALLVLDKEVPTNNHQVSPYLMCNLTLHISSFADAQTCACRCIRVRRLYTIIY